MADSGVYILWLFEILFLDIYGHFPDYFFISVESLAFCVFSTCVITQFLLITVIIKYNVAIF